MTNKKEIMFVQFFHPGAEYPVSLVGLENGEKNWNTLERHYRSFMKAKGQYVLASGLSERQELNFWGEWEPTAYVAKLPTGKTYGLPNWMFSPFLRVDKNGKLVKTSCLPQNCGSSKDSNCCSPDCGCLNTDPFVFGDYFLYSLCRQSRLKVMKRLERGSVILMGTHFRKGGAPAFYLDTVFVVDEYRTYKTSSYKTDLEGFVPDLYFDLMGFDAWKKEEEFVCYKGATYRNPVNGMYSFAPCKPYIDGTSGFPRVKVDCAALNAIRTNVASETMNTGVKTNVTDLQTNKKLWDAVCKMVADCQCEKGVNFSYQTLIVP